MKLSVAMQNAAVLALASELNGGVIRFYGSTVSEAAALALVPASAGDAVAGTLLCTISSGGLGTGINMDTVPSSGVLGKDTGETWLGEYVATGYPSYCRFSALTDAGGSSTTEVRVQQTVGVLGKEIIISSALKTLGDEQRLDSYFLGVPAE